LGEIQMGFFQEFRNIIRDNPVIRRWVIVLIFVLILSCTFLTIYTYINTNEELSNINYQIDPNVIDPKLNLSADYYQVPDSAEKVTTGIYVDRIRSLTLKENTWTVDFFIWFKWTGDKDPSQNFQVVDGTIDKKEVIKNSTNSTPKFALYKVTATITNNYNMFRFPVDNQFLTIDIQDKQYPRSEMVYVPDNETSEIGPGVNVPGYSIGGLRVVEKPFTYDSTMGDYMEKSTTYSQFRSGILLSREDLTVFILSLIGTFLAVFAGLMALTIVAFQSRFSLTGASLFVGVTNMILISNIAPTGVITVAHIITTFGLFIIALSLLESAISITFYNRGDESLARDFDLVTLPILAIGFVVTVLTVLLAAL
jgi:hypothetical protein